MNAIIFDFDGTIANSFDVVLDFLLKKAGRTPATVTAEQRQAYKSLSMRQLALQVGVPAWRLPLLFFQGKTELTKHMHRLNTFDGVDEVLAELAAADYRMYIISSNSRRNIKRFFSEHGLSGYFIRIYGNAGWFSKGAVLRRALRQNHLQAAKTVYVGDEVRDIMGAHQANMPSIAVSWGFGSKAELLKHNPTIVVRTPQELKQALLDWGNAN